MRLNKVKQSTISKIEFELLSTLFDYVVPFLDNKVKPKEEQRSGLENIVHNSKPKIGIGDLKELENLILSRNGDIKAARNFGRRKNNLIYSLNLARTKNKDENKIRYSIVIKYDENQFWEKLKIKIKDEEREVYSSELTNIKDKPDKVAPYSVKIAYEDNYAEERLTITYKQQLRNYRQKHIEEKEDMTNRVPLKWLNILPETMMGGVLGFTYLGENFMARRTDLVGKTARMVDIHESIHTPDEYETRVLTSWIMEKVRRKYVK